RNDVLTGDAGDNILDGGVDSLGPPLVGHAQIQYGADTLDGGTGSDTVSYAHSNSGSGVIVDLSVQLTWDG
ncbi:hypothetical protein, partial [Burkholderia cenocepacia]|uniref:hypothetical protein n=1 Tax=Burkholderia cenocepacia TaxID=95486 RepID=UPI0009CB896D